MNVFFTFEASNTLSMNSVIYSKPIIHLKRLIASAVTFKPVSRLIRKLFENKIPYYSTIVYTDSQYIEDSIIGLLFLNAYESCEIRFINDYLLKDYPVVELGSSIGVVTMQIAKLTNKNVYSFEANPYLIDIIQNNLDKNGVFNCQLNNKIIGAPNHSYYFVPGNDNTTGTISDSFQDGAIKVESISLSDLIRENNILEYVLVCDIEGAEVFILKDDIGSLGKCRQVIIELHDTSYCGVNYSISDLIKMFQSVGFEVKDKFSGNVVFSREPK